MKPVRKALLITAASALGVYLFVLFVLVTFPYHALVSRIDAGLRSTAGAGFSAQQVSFRYPLTLELREVSVFLRGGAAVTAERMALRLRPRVFAPQRELEMQAWGVGVRSDAAVLSGMDATIGSKARLLPLLRGGFPEAVHSLQVTLGSADIDRVTLGGLEFTALALHRARVGLEAQEGWFVLREGEVTGDVVTARLGGRMSTRRMEVDVIVWLTEEFYRRYRDLRGLAESLFTGGTLEITLRGAPARPEAGIKSGTAR
ncbi:MAG: hypothetical protein ACOC8N_07715 [Spirochaetota bacterium]